MSTEAERRAWCYLRNLVHTTYREIRHVGFSGDLEAKLSLPKDHSLAEAAKRCSNNRTLLKRRDLFQQTAAAESVDEVVKPYRDAVGLELADLESLFAESGWTSRYGGQKWAEIARNASRLACAIETGDIETALKVCDVVQRICHNSGPLVPSLDEWRSKRYLREKWPQRCDAEGAGPLKSS